MDIVRLTDKGQFVLFKVASALGDSPALKPEQAKVTVFVTVTMTALNPESLAFKLSVVMAPLEVCTDPGESTGMLSV